MKVYKITCNNTAQCHEDTILLEPMMVSIWHLPNNHILLMENDYNVDGSVKKSANLKSEINKIDADIIGKVNQVIDRDWK